MKYDWEAIDALRERGHTWPEIADITGVNQNTLRSANQRRNRPRTPTFTHPIFRLHPDMQNVQTLPSSGMRILGIDIETAPNTAHVWGLYKQTIGLNQILQTGRVMCFAARWFPGDETMFYSEFHDGHGKMIAHAHRLLSDADAVVHYNGNRFDVPTLNREFLSAGMVPPVPYAQIDLLQIARKQFRFASNRLDHLLKELGLGEKVRHDGHELWVKCMNGDPEAWERMEAYNRGDVNQLEALYNRMRPWITNHPNHALYQETDRPTCTNCGGTDLQSRGTSRTKTQMYRRYQCQGCGTWNRERFNDTPKAKKTHILTQA